MNARRNLFFASVAAAVAVTLFLLLRAPSVPKGNGKVHQVVIQGMLFKPASLQIEPGDSVNWTNEDIFVHAVKSNDPKNAWQSKDLKPHDSWSKVFTAGGPYLCPYHPTMTGEISVSEAKAEGAR